MIHNPYDPPVPEESAVPEMTTEEIHARIRADLGHLGEIVSISDESPFSGVFGARKTLFSRPPGVKVKIKFHSWSFAMNVFTHWNATLGRFDYYNRMERQIVLHPKEPSKITTEIFDRLREANDMTANAVKTRGPWMELEMFTLLWAVMTMIGIPLGATLRNNMSYDNPLYSPVGWGIVVLLAVLFPLLITSALRGSQRKKQQKQQQSDLELHAWPNMPYHHLSKKDWNLNPFGMIDTLFRDDTEKQLFLADLAASAQSSGITYLGHPRTHELVANGKVVAMVVTTGNSDPGSGFTFPALSMNRPVIIFDGMVDNEKQLVAWDGTRFFYTLKMDEESMTKHMSRFGNAPGMIAAANRMDTHRVGYRRRGKHINNLNIGDVIGAAAMMHMAPPNPHELFPA